MIIREAALEDIRELVKIRLDYLNEDFKGLTDGQTQKLKEELPGYFTEHIGRDLVVYIAEEAGEIISSVFLLMIEKPANPNFMTGRIGELLNVYTNPEYRRQGIAGKLLSMSIESAKKKKLSFLELKASEEGYPLYKKMGFEEVNSWHRAMKLVI